MHVLAPFIEQLHSPTVRLNSLLNKEQREALNWRSHASIQICNSLIKTEVSDGYSVKQAYRDLAKVLADYPRLALYLPFRVLRDAPESFRGKYLEAWTACWAYRDARECFNQGDIYEEGSYDGEIEFVVKAMHLVPWLVEYGYLTEGDVEYILHLGSNHLRASSLLDAIEVLRRRNMLSPTTNEKIDAYAAGIERPRKPVLIRETEARRIWREDRERNYGVSDEFRLGKVAGPFLENVPEEVFKQIKPRKGEFLLFGGSKLKGYGRNGSDYDLYHYNLYRNTIIELEDVSNDPPIHCLTLTMAWIGEEAEMTEVAQMYAAQNYFYLDEDTHRNCLLRLESDLLQFRLMHKGFPLAYANDCSRETREYTSIDGASAFYDDRYREIATELYLKYIVLP